MSGNNPNRGLGQAGMVSFLVTMIMMLVITLIIVGFSQVTRHNAREALDRQLSAEAFYAAESGINVARSAISGYLADNSATNLAKKTSCANDYEPDTTQSSTGQGGPISDLGTGVKYTCVLVDPIPKDLQFPASQQKSTIVPITVSGGGALTSMTFTWAGQPESDGSLKTTCASGSDDYQFSPTATWDNDCDIGVLRLDLVANPNVSAVDATTLMNNTVTIFLTPRSSSHTATRAIVYGGFGVPTYVVPGTDAKLGTGACTSGTCQATLTFSGSSSSFSNYMLRATMLYNDSSSIDLTGSTASGNARFVGSQAVIDVTGRAQDQLRRIQARVALTSSADAATLPLNALGSSNTICKHFTVLSSDPPMDNSLVCGG